ncbi:MAG: methylthioribose-1-phosphate isomerase, partial [Thermoproteota archaeon]
VAPTSSFDLDAFSGDSIDIELRDESEIKEINGVPIAPLTSPALNPSFDITDSDLITGIICEKGMIKPPFNQNVRKVVLS